MNGGAWQDYRRIWTATTTRRNPQGVLWGGRLALLVALALGMAKLAGLGGRTSFWKAELLVAVGWFGMVWMMLFLPASVLMNSAPNARLVPRLRRRLLQMGAGSWALVTVGPTLAFGTWTAFPLFAAYMLGVMLQRTGIRSAVSLIVLASMWPLLSTRLPAALVQAVTSTPGLLALSVLLVLGAAWGLARLYPAGGDRHLDGREQVVTSLRRLEHRDTGAKHGLSWLDRLAYTPALRHACLQGKPDTLLLHALGPAAHWSAWVPGLGIILLIALALSVFLTTGGEAMSPAVAHGVFGTGMAVLNTMIVSSIAQFTQALRKTRGEQALLRLTPLAGNAALLNRRLANAMTKTALVNWGMVTALLLLVAWLIGADGAILLRQFALSCLGGLLALSGLLGDFARSLPGVSRRQFLTVVLLGGAGAALQGQGGMFWLGLVLASVAGAAVLLTVARRRMLAAPPAFPVERLEQTASASAYEGQR